MFVKNLLQYEAVQHFFNGIRVVVAVLILNAVKDMGKKAILDKICLGIAVVSLLVSLFFSLSPILIVIAAALVGLFVKRKEAAE